jgi:D-beta-D-heptose 7-phosphate kinase/D-beta-D-heptose 1-phosphate adenosyltransferase
LPGTKIVSLNRLKTIIAGLKRAGKKIVFTNGCFDILHYGHVKYLQDARAKGDYLVVAVNSDASVKKIKGKDRPVIGELDRMRTLAALACVDFIVLFNQSDPLKVIKTLKPDYLVKGSDWNSKNIIGADFVKERGGKVLTVKLVSGRSTTALIKKIVKVFS